MEEEPVVKTETVKEKARRKRRIKYITQKINDMKKQRTFMTAPKIGEEIEEDEEVTPPPPPEPEEQSNIFEDYNNMLMDLVNF